MAQGHMQKPSRGASHLLRFQGICQYLRGNYHSVKTVLLHLIPGNLLPIHCPLGPLSFKALHVSALPSGGLTPLTLPQLAPHPRLEPCPLDLLCSWQKVKSTWRRKPPNLKRQEHGWGMGKWPGRKVLRKGMSLSAHGEGNVMVVRCGMCPQG